MYTIVDVVIPIGTAVFGALVGAAVSWAGVSYNYHKKIITKVFPDQKLFKIYNTGNFGVAISSLGIMIERKNALFEMPFDKTMTPQSEPESVTYDEEKLWMDLESSLAGSKHPKKFCCFVKSADGKLFKNKANMPFNELWKYHEYYFGRNQDVSDEPTDLPF